MISSPSQVSYYEVFLERLPTFTAVLEFNSTEPVEKLPVVLKSTEYEEEFSVRHSKINLSDLTTGFKLKEKVNLTIKNEVFDFETQF